MPENEDCSPEGGGGRCARSELFSRVFAFASFFVRYCTFIYDGAGCDSVHLSLGRVLRLPARGCKKKKKNSRQSTTAEETESGRLRVKSTKQPKTATARGRRARENATRERAAGKNNKRKQTRNDQREHQKCTRAARRAGEKEGAR